MFNLLNIYRNHPIARMLSDVRSLGLVVFAIIAILVTWSGAKAVQSNYKLQQEIAQLEQQNTLQELKNNNQKLKNQYYNTPQYLELAARQNFGLALPGEKELIVPKAVAMARVAGIVPISNPSSSIITATKKDQPLFQSNIQDWLNFFLHRKL